MKVGDLLKYTWYGLIGASLSGEKYGLFLRKATKTEQNQDWGDIWVWTESGEQRWTSWECEVINED